MGRSAFFSLEHLQSSNKRLYGIWLTFPFNNHSSMRHLENIQLRALHACLGLRKTTPTNIVLAETGEGPLRFRFELLTSKYILKIFALDSHPLIDKLFALLWYSRKSRRINPSEKFLLFKAFSSLLRIKIYISKFDYPAVYSIDYYALISLPSVIITPPVEAERIKNAPIPQIIFLEIYKELISSRTCFYTDASENDSDDYVGFAIYSPPPTYSFYSKLILILSSSPQKLLPSSIPSNIFNSNQLRNLLSSLTPKALPRHFFLSTWLIHTTTSSLL